VTQRNPAAGKIIAEREGDQDQQPHHASDRSQMQKPAASLDLHEE